MTSVFRENIVDMLTPLDAEQQSISVTTESTATLHTSRAITLLFDYTDTEPNGVIPPLDLTIIPTHEGEGVAIRKTFRRQAPTRFTFYVQSAGRYVVLLKERFHNKTFGLLILDVAGDSAIDIPLARRQRYG